jgi:hypothetical protein
MAGKSGNVGSHPGGVGAVGGEADFIPVLPDRVDLPFVTDTVHDIKISDQTTGVTYFPDRRWSAEWRAWYALSEYVKTGYSAIPPIPWPDPTEKHSKGRKLTSEIDDLVVAARDERADALGEIVAQHDGFASYFFALLTSEPALYPATNLLVNIASIVATFTVLFYKNGVAGRYKPRPRPSHVCPALLPPIPVPGHPSYPSGHATEAHLIALVLNQVFQSNDQSSQASKAGKREPAMNYDLTALANRIARNREIAGLHYRSDSDAGKKMAADIWRLLQDPGCTVFAKAMTDAQNEWLDQPI